MDGSPASDSGAPQKEEPAQESAAINPPIVPPSTPANHEPGNRQPSPKKKKRPSKHSYRKWALLINGILAAAAIAAGWFYYRQLKEMKRTTGAAIKATKLTERSLILAQMTARLDQRAWVAPIEIKSDVIEGQEFSVRVTFKNTGRTFANEVGIKLVIQMLPSLEIPDFDEAEKLVSIKSQGILSPEGICYGDKTTWIALTRDQVEGIRSGKTSVYVHGRIEYADVFKCGHWTAFAFQLHTDGKNETSYAAFGTHNNQAGDEPCNTPTPTP